MHRHSIVNVLSLEVTLLFFRLPGTTELFHISPKWFFLGDSYDKKEKSKRRNLLLPVKPKGLICMFCWISWTRWKMEAKVSVKSPPGFCSLKQQYCIDLSWMINTNVLVKHSLFWPLAITSTWLLQDSDKKLNNVNRFSFLFITTPTSSSSPTGLHTTYFS